MIKLIAVDSAGTGYGLTVTPGWELTFSFSESVGASDDSFDEALKRVTEETLLEQDFHRTMLKGISQQLVTDETLVAYFTRILGSETSLAESLELLITQRISSVTHVSDSTRLLIAHMLENELALSDVLRKTMERSIGEEIVMESILDVERSAIEDSALIEDELIVEAVKLLTTSASLNEQIYREAFKLLQDSMLVSEVLSVALFKVLHDDDYINVQEQEDVNRIRVYLDSLTLVSELTLFFERELYDESELAEILNAELFKSVAEAYALADSLSLNVFEPGTVLVAISFVLQDKFIMRISTRSVSADRSDGDTEGVGRISDSSGLRSRNVGSAGVEGNVGLRTTQRSLVGTNSMVRFKNT